MLVLFYLVFGFYIIKYNLYNRICQINCKDFIAVCSISLTPVGRGGEKRSFPFDEKGRKEAALQLEGEEREFLSLSLSTETKETEKDRFSPMDHSLRRR